MYWPLSLQRIKRKAKVFMGKRLVCHWKELSAVNLITTLLLSLHLSLSLSLLLCFQLLPSLAEPEQAKRESMCERDQCHPHHNQCGMFHQQKIFPSPVCMLDLAIHKVRQTLLRAPSLSKCFLIGCMWEKIPTNNSSQTFEMGWQAGELFVHH